jgi:hypothetical protein
MAKVESAAIPAKAMRRRWETGEFILSVLSGVRREESCKLRASRSQDRKAVATGDSGVRERTFLSGFEQFVGL